MTASTRLSLAATALLLPSVAVAQARLPLKLAPRATSAPITAADLMTRLYIFSDDSMMGRQAGTEGNLKGTAYIAAEVKRMGLVPAGDDGGYFQNLPYFRRAIDESASSVAVEGGTLALGTDIVPSLGRGAPRPFDGAQVVYGGSTGADGSLISPEQAKGKFVIITSSSTTPARGRFRLPATPALDGAAAIALVGLDDLPARFRQGFGRSSLVLETGDSIPMQFIVSRHAAEVLLGAPLDGAQPGAIGKTVHGRIAITETPAPARNVVAILPGSDPKLKGEYVAIGAHNDHIGLRRSPADFDSLRAYNDIVWQMRDSSALNPRPSADQLAGIQINVDSLHRLHPARIDSINNGADDDGSGSVTVLEIAQNLVAMHPRPKRSILFVWHTGEEAGLLGSLWFTDHPTVPRDSIVAQLNMDMVGRGAAADTKGGGPGYLQLVGSRRLSTELGDLVESVNKGEKQPLTFDYAFDADGQPERIYCRSDHYEYARYGIPITFFTTGLHKDYHQVTDEPQFIDYPHMARIGNFVRDLTVRVADLDHRVVVDKPKPDPKAACKQ